MYPNYEKPFIQKVQTGLINKFGTSTLLGRNIKREIDGVTIDDLVDQYGSPLFVFSEHTIRRQFRKLYRTFSTRYPNVQFGWSYKTNYLKAICAIFHQEGALAELVSKMEYDKAKALGIPGNQIILNGPHKPIELLEAAIADGVTINIDHFDEIEDLEKVARRLGKVVKVGIRLNLDAGIYPKWSRFGFNLESGQALEAAKRIAESDVLVTTGLHCHIGTFILDPQAYARQLKLMVKFGYELEEKFGVVMEYFDIGGGFPSRNRLKGNYHATDVSVPAIDEYADAITDTLWETLKAGHQPKLIIESGRALIDEAGTLITSVCAAKRLPDGTRAYVMDAGVNLLFTAFWYRFNIALDRSLPGPVENSILYGPLCMNIDVIDEGLPLPPLPRGSRLIISPAGAYNVTQWMQFIEYRPNVVLIRENNTVEIIRHAEDLSTLDQQERLPESWGK